MTKLRPTSLLRQFAAALVALCAAVTVFSYSADAHAAKIPIPYHTGEDIFEAGPIPEPFDKEPDLQGWSAGYKCEIFGLFWSYLSISDCKPVIFKDDQYMDAEGAPEVIAKVSATYTEDDKKVGLWTRFGFYLLVLGGLAFGAFSMFAGNDDDDDESSDDSEDEAKQNAA